MIRLLRDIAVDPELTVDDDNPLAVPEQRVVEGNLIGSGGF